MTTFSDWLLSELVRKNMTQADLARASGVTNAQISRVISGSRGVGTEALTKIAKALQISPQTILEKAGILPEQSPETELLQQISYIAKDLPEDEQEGLLEYAKLRQKISQEKGANGKQPSRAAFPTPTQPK